MSAIDPRQIEESRKSGIIAMGDRSLMHCDCREIDEALLSPEVRHTMTLPNQDKHNAS
jgi:hypothetical protein